MKSQILILSLASLAVAGCHRPSHETKEAPALPTVNVSAETIALETARSREEIPGTIQSVDRAMISAKVVGTIDSLPVNLGQEVKEGDLLVSVLAGEISAKVLQAQAQLNQTVRDLDRERDLLTKGASTAETVAALEDGVRVLQAAVSEAETMLSYTKIRAPFDGVVTRKMANEGDLASPGMPLLVIENPKFFEVGTDIPEMLAQTIAVGSEVEVTMPGWDWTGMSVITEMSPAADPGTRTFHAKVAVPDGAPVRSGQFARIRLPGRPIETILVPTAAVSTYGQIEIVYTVEENRADMRIIKTGMTYSDHIEVLAGLSAGDVVITNPPANLIDGQPVEINR